MRVYIQSVGNQDRDVGGLMIRDDVTNDATGRGSEYFFSGWSRNRGRILCYYRTTQGGNSQRVEGSINSLPAWVRITKTGTTYRAYESNNGSSWNLIRTQTIGNLDNNYFGLATTEGRDNVLTTAVYDDFQVPSHDSYTNQYYTSGTITSSDIIPVGTLQSWDTLSWSETLEADTDIEMDVWGYNSSTWVEVLSNLTNPAGEDLSSINPAIYSRLRLVGNLSTTNDQNTPWLNSWQVDYTASVYTPAQDSRHPVPERETYCADCHTPHRDPNIYPKLLFEWNSDGTRTYYPDSGGPIGNTYCFGCHGIWDNTYVNGTYYDNSGGDHETNYTGPHSLIGYLPASSNDATCNITPVNGSGLQCLLCHKQHGSSGSQYLNAYQQGSAADEENLCYNCHEDSTGSSNTWNGRYIKDEFARTSKHDITSASGAKVECASCHNSHFVNTGGGSNWDLNRISNPDDTQENPASVTAFCLACHDGTPPSKGFTATSVIPYTIQFPDMSTYALFPGWDKSAFSASSHFSGSNALCQNCHDPHGSNFARLTAYNRDNTTAGNSQEQNLCYQCHDGTPGIDIQSMFSKTYTHTITNTDRHSDTESGSDFDNSNRHAECVDCHNPHEAQTGTHTIGSKATSNVLLGVSGVLPDVSTPAWNTITSFTEVFPITFEAQLCFKCHSYYAYGNTPPAGQTDQAKEFNPNNASYHAVWGASKAPNQGTYLGGFSYNSDMYCSDCHGSDTGTDPEGPHGSNTDMILKGTWGSGVTPENMSSSLCGNCHDFGTDGSDTTKTGFAGGGDNLHLRRHDREECVDCHSAVPHGSDNPHMWVFGDDPAPYKAPTFDGRPTPWPHIDSDNWQQNDCHDVSFGCG